MHCIHFFLSKGFRFQSMHSKVKLNRFLAESYFAFLHLNCKVKLDFFKSRTDFFVVYFSSDKSYVFVATLYTQ